jgi:hypothetical protein
MSGLQLDAFAVGLTVMCCFLSFLFHFDCQEGITALHLASLWGHEKIADLLLKAKANPNAANKVRLILKHFSRVES